MLSSPVAASEIDVAIEKAAAVYHHDPKLMKAIAMVESGLNPDAVGDNGKSFGLFQINNYWLKRFNIPKSEMMDTSLNALWAAYVLHDCFSRYPDHYWRAVGCYNVGSEHPGTDERGRKSYAQKVYAKFQLLSEHDGLYASVQER